MMTCPNCKREYVAELETDRTGMAYWISGTKLIQHAFPDARSEAREQLVSGLCSDKCYAEYVGIEEHEEDDGCQFDGGDE